MRKRPSATNAFFRFLESLCGAKKYRHDLHKRTTRLLTTTMGGGGPTVMRCALPTKPNMGVLMLASSLVPSVQFSSTHTVEK